MMNDAFHLGVDVGSGSVRVGLVNTKGEVLRNATTDIEIHNPQAGHYEQSSKIIWDAVKDSVRTVLNQNEDPLEKSQIKSIGFAATCSLVVVCDDDKLTVGDRDDFDIIMWMDHRAEKEASYINQSARGHKILDYVGGQVSLEMQLPKLLWLKSNRKQEVWEKATQFFDLPDWLTYRATGDDTRSLCSVVCKWNYWMREDGSRAGWDQPFFQCIGLEDLEQNNWRRIGTNVHAPARPVGQGLSILAAEDLGLVPGTPVGASLIDAHAGALGMMASCGGPAIGRLGLVSGTSTCHMLLSEAPHLVPGVWGPYNSVILEKLWLMEGGQSATGALIDHMLKSHPEYKEVAARAAHHGVTVYAELENELEEERARRGLKHTSLLASSLHVYPDFHGNRSPLADPKMSGMLSGLSLNKDRTELALIYLATIQAISYGTRHIVETLEQHGHKVESLAVCGGLTTSQLYIQTQADVLGKPVAVPKERHSVLVGAALLGAGACQPNEDLQDLMGSLKGRAHAITFSEDWEVIQYHQKKYKVYKAMLEDQLKYRQIMEGNSC